MIVGPTSSTPKTIEELLGADLMARLDRLDVFSRKVFAGRLPGERRSKRRGHSSEFDDYRTYVPGDDLRHIDWNVFARLDRLFIKLFREEEDLALTVALDTSASMHSGDPSKLVFAHRLAMAIAYVGLVNLNRVSIVSFGGAAEPGFWTLPPQRGRRHVEHAARFLLESVARPSVRTDADGRSASPIVSFHDGLRRIGSKREGRGVMVLISDLLVREGIGPALNFVAGRGAYDVHCVQVLSPAELDPTLEHRAGFAGDLRLTDAETGRGTEVTIDSAMLKSYRERLGRFLEDTTRTCAVRGIGHLVVQSDADISQLLLDQLRRRGLFH